MFQSQVASRRQLAIIRRITARRNAGGRTAGLTERFIALLSVLAASALLLAYLPELMVALMACALVLALGHN
ncbi:MAG: hypothetical protein AAGI11_07955 [Pseudomonadota bacterium]